MLCCMGTCCKTKRGMLGLRCAVGQQLGMARIYIEKGNGENVMSCFSLKPPGKGEKQRKKKSTFKKIRDPTGK